MSARRAFRGGPWLPAAAVAALVVAALAALVWAVRPSPPVATTGSAPVAVRQSVEPSGALFGDRLQAELDVTTLDARVDPGSVRVAARFGPFAVVGSSVRRTSAGGASVVRARYSLACLAGGCLPPTGGARTFVFPPAVVSFRRDGEETRLAAPWDAIRVASRLEPGEARLADTPPRVGVGLSVSPSLLRGLLVALAIVLGVAGAWLAATGIRPRLVRWRRRRLSRLELALAELDDAVRVEDEGRRRRVLDQLATRLGEADEGALEERSRRLAWSRVPPPGEELVALGDQVRAGLDGGGR